MVPVSAEADFLHEMAGHVFYETARFQTFHAHPRHVHGLAVIPVEGPARAGVCRGAVVAIRSEIRSAGRLGERVGVQQRRLERVVDGAVQSAVLLVPPFGEFFLVLVL